MKLSLGLDPSQQRKLFLKHLSRMFFFCSVSLCTEKKALTPPPLRVFIIVSFLMTKSRETEVHQNNFLFQSVLASPSRLHYNINFTLLFLANGGFYRVLRNFWGIFFFPFTQPDVTLCEPLYVISKWSKKKKKKKKITPSYSPLKKSYFFCPPFPS